MLGYSIGYENMKDSVLDKIPKAFFDTGVVKWGVKTDAEIDLRGEPTDRREWKKAQIHAVRALVEMARTEKLMICHEVELDLELMHSTSSRELKRINSLLSGVKLHRVESPFKHARILAGWGVTKECADNMRQEMLDFAIANYSRIGDIHEAIGGNKKADAYHIWTTECADVEFFVSMDKKLVNSARNQRKVPFRIEIVYPMELINRLGLETESLVCRRASRN